ncbi:transporter substrate-binding domain-containing protein [uncultured Ruegeria sp.]|uniref:transporter substrate-binding domain-containing protein n=1 Tax=uncultured Ruegeria sp. TaxID=259304 RepID=UPI0026240403|nr:transporter substrate-binding domain-containing protein [uncultured Ruegeria sp.]
MITKRYLMGAAAASLMAIAGSAFAGEALDRVMSNNVLKVATDANWPPQSFVNENNEMDGFDVDVARAIAERLGVGIEFVTPDWGVITAGRWNGRWDISVGSMTPTKERATVLDFPAVYYYTPNSLGVHEDSTATTPSDLSGKVVGATEATTYYYYLDHSLVIDGQDINFQIDPGEIRSYPSTAPGLDDLRLGDGVRLDGIIAGFPPLVKAIEDGYPIKIVGDPLFYEPLTVAIDRGDKEFNDKLAEIIEAMHEDGTLTEISLKWFNHDFTKGY